MKKAKRNYVMTARAAKARDTIARIKASTIQLYHDRPIEFFTLDDVAERAGVTVRTVLRAFGSKDELIYAALGEMAAGGVFLKPTPPGDVKAGVSAFFDIYEAIGDLVIRHLNDEQRHPELKPLLDQGRENHRDGVKEIFAPQLARLRGAARAQLLNTLDVMTDVYVWKLLRRDMGLGRAPAEAIVRNMIERVTEGRIADGKDSLAELVGRRQSAS
jgi:AcrR family transcriptional regulator